MVILTLLEPQTNQPLQHWEFSQQSLIRIGRRSKQRYRFTWLFSGVATTPRIDRNWRAMGTH